MSGFDSIMVHVEIGVSRKLRRFTAEERWCAVAGVWALAAKSPIRGYLLITEKLLVEDEDIAEQAGVKLSVARSTLKKMRDLEMLERDEEIGAEHVHDWHEHQSEPKPSESKSAWRERKRAQRRARDTPADVTAGVTRDIGTPVPSGPAGVSHPLREEKGRQEKDPPVPPASGGRKRVQDQFAEELAQWVAVEFPDIEPTAAKGYARHALGLGLRTRDEVRASVLKATRGLTGAAA